VQESRNGVLPAGHPKTPMPNQAAYGDADTRRSNQQDLQKLAKQEMHKNFLLARIQLDPRIILPTIHPRH
jgi:hypothetical protein